MAESSFREEPFSEPSVRVTPPLHDPAPLPLAEYWAG